MTGPPVLRPVTRVYLHVTLARGQRALSKVPATRHSGRPVPSVLAFLSTADYADQQATSTTTDQHRQRHTRHNPDLGISR
jgi:hypothetical protein